MEKFDSFLVATHIVYRNAPPFEPLEGPYSSVAKALLENGGNVYSCQLPIKGFEKPLVYGPWRNGKLLKLPALAGKVAPIKYLLDALVFSVAVLVFTFKNIKSRRLVVGVDPLSCLPLTALRKILDYKLIFYSVDFNRTRFKSGLMQFLYEKADELSSKHSDQTWVVCQSLKDYKKDNYGVESIYMPNSAVFDAGVFEEGKKYKKGNKMAWTGSFLTERQYDILFSLLAQIQTLRPDMEFYFAPMSNHIKFRECCSKYGLNKSEVVELHSRRQWQEFAAKCDSGIAIYDSQFGSTEFIEPLKIWDFMACGMPFIISCEPSISQPIKDSGVVYFLGPDNKITDAKSLGDFLQKENLEALQSKCVNLAREYSIDRQIKTALAKLI